MRRRGAQPMRSTLHDACGRDIRSRGAAPTRRMGGTRSFAAPRPIKPRAADCGHSLCCGGGGGASAAALASHDVRMQPFVAAAKEPATSGPGDITILHQSPGGAAGPPAADRVRLGAVAVDHGDRVRPAVVGELAQDAEEGAKPTPTPIRTRRQAGWPVGVKVPCGPSRWDKAGRRVGHWSVAEICHAHDAGQRRALRSVRGMGRRREAGR
jgi:hypothetical protein